MTTTERRILYAAGQALEGTTGLEAEIHPAPERHRENALALQAERWLDNR